MLPLPQVTLKKNRESPIKAGHPWVFSQAIERADEVVQGGLIDVLSHDGKFLGVGTWNGKNTIRIRIISHDPGVAIDTDFFVAKFKVLDNSKKPHLPKETTGYRVVQADADGLPGLILDRYGDVFVFQVHTIGMEKLKDIVVEAIQKAFKPSAIVERSDVDARKQEGLMDRPIKVHHGKIDKPVEFLEFGHKFYADTLEGQKTGFFLDQRNARIKVGQMAKGRNVLNLFGYSGAFSVYAAKAGAAKVATVDVSAAALTLAEKNFELNGLELDKNKYEFVEADVFDVLNDRKYTDGFDFVICDPPAFAKSADKLPEAMRAYIDLNRRCFEMLKEGGILVSSSCSGRVTPSDFRDVLRIAAGQARRDVRILEFMGQPIDHTEKLAFPEGRYLKTVFLEVTKVM